ncbi:hypothetical protein CDEST_12488 [Colletotrichum destructivum]|uniref:Uncharacterized protein n=1 Tax=Colletotrichum destructivum TaxID=34406 RepID=A0AAX4IW11_9PEZI|nr:hypothetical protein CDEST_12488 [Colletotrichum destructivum]
MYLLSHQHNATADEKRVQRRTQDGMAAFIPRWLKMRAQRLGQGISGDRMSAASRYRLRPAPPGYHTLPSVEIFKAQGSGQSGRKDKGRGVVCRCRLRRVCSTEYTHKQIHPNYGYTVHNSGGV